MNPNLPKDIGVEEAWAVVRAKVRQFEAWAIVPFAFPLPGKCAS